MTSRHSACRGAVLGWFAAFLIAGFLLVAAGLYNLVTLTRDAAVLRRAIVATDGVESHLRIQGSVGPVVLGAVRAGLRFVDDVPAEAHRALAAVRGGSVAVYELAARPTAPARQAMVDAASDAMRERGWTRAVTVQEGENMVLVFAPSSTTGTRRVRVCVVVCSGHELVVAEARLSAAELRELVAEHLPGGGLLAGSRAVPADAPL